MKTLRTISSALSCAALMSALALVTHAPRAQAIDDRDLQISANRETGDVDMVQTDAGITIVAAWVEKGSQQSGDDLVIARSDDRGRSWKAHYRGTFRRTELARISLGVAAGYGASAYKDRFIYVALECADRLNMSGTTNHWLEVVHGPLDTPWTSYGTVWPHRTRVVSRTAATSSNFIDMRPSLALAPYRDSRGVKQYLVAIAHFWMEKLPSGGASFEVHVRTPYYGNLGRVNPGGTPIYNAVVAGPGMLYAAGRRPALAAHRTSQFMYLAIQDPVNHVVQVAKIDSHLFRRGFGFQHELTTRTQHWAPEIAVRDSTVVMTALDPAFADWWVSTSTSMPLTFKGAFAGLPESSAPISLQEDRLAIACTISYDPPYTAPPVVWAFTGRPTDAQLAPVRLGDTDAEGSPAVAMSPYGIDRAIVAYSRGLGWIWRNKASRVYVDYGL